MLPLGDVTVSCLKDPSGQLTDGGNVWASGPPFFFTLSLSLSVPICPHPLLVIHQPLILLRVDGVDLRCLFLFCFGNCIYLPFGNSLSWRTGGKERVFLFYSFLTSFSLSSLSLSPSLSLYKGN